MAYKIIDSQCTLCGMCEPICPNEAIFEKRGMFHINADLCTECEGFSDYPQCDEVCPVPSTCVPL